MSEKQNEPVFPLTTEHHYHHDGMTLRDWFAGQALAGLMAEKDNVSAPINILTGTAYEYADAMLAERAKKEGQS